MSRLACVDLPAFPLQLLLGREPSWRAHAVVVVDRDRPSGKVLWRNERARVHGIRAGMRYAAALSLDRDLRAGTVDDAEIRRAVDGAVVALRRHTPFVEPSADEPGVFWLDATGLDRLVPSFEAWARGVLEDVVVGRGWCGAIVVGFSKFGTYAVARGGSGVGGSGVGGSGGEQRVDPIVFDAFAAESAAARAVPLDRLAIAPKVFDVLDKLAVRTVGDFAALPPEDIATRFGTDAAALHRLARGALSPLHPAAPESPMRQSLDLDYAERDSGRLLVIVERLLAALVTAFATRGEAITELAIVAGFDGGGRRVERIAPAAPTLDMRQLLELIRLRLESVQRAGGLVAGVVAIAIAGEGVRAPAEQLELFAERPPRDLAAANRALARVRATLGDDAVVRGRLREGHLPEARFVWERLERLGAAEPPPCAPTGALVRRIYPRPIALPARPRHEPDGWMLRNLTEGPVVRVSGPYVVSGGWWRRRVQREYHFAETEAGDVLWVYFDRFRRRWFVHGRLE